MDPKDGNITTLGTESSDESSPATKTGFKRYNMYYTTSRMNARLHEGSKDTPALYYFETQVSHVQPQFLLRRGDSKQAPMIYSAMLNKKPHCLICKGDFKNQPESELVWEELHRDQDLVHRSDYNFSTSEGNPPGCRSAYVWKKDMQKKLTTIYECRDEAGKVVATFASGGNFNWRKGAEIEIVKGLDQGLEEMLIMTAMAIWGREGSTFRSNFSGFGKS